MNDKTTYNIIGQPFDLIIKNEKDEIITDQNILAVVYGHICEAIDEVNSKLREKILMKEINLTRTDNGSNFKGECSNLSGECSNLKGDYTPGRHSGIYTGICGDLDPNEISDEEEK